MTNEILFFISIFFYFSLVLIAYKFFGKTGLYMWAAVATIISSLEVAKVVTLFGMNVTLGNVIYGSSFLVTDILSENYDKKSANTAVNIGIFISIAWVLSTQLILLFVPNAEDFINPSLQTVFSLVPRLTIGSVATYVVSQKLDIFLYHFWWEKTGSNKNWLWLRNNGSTLISQFVDTVVFTIIAFLGVFEFNVLIELIFTTYAVKIFVSVLDTPAVYISRKLNNNYLKNTIKTA